MRIAIVGAGDSVEKIYNILSKKYKKIEFILKKEDKIENTLKIIKEIESEVEGIYLTGIGVYYSLLNNKELEINKPVVYTKRGSIGLIKSFWELQKDSLIEDNIRLGWDIVEGHIFNEVVKEFDIELKGSYYQKYEPNKTENEYLENYLEKYNSKEINCIFTAFGYIYNKLKEKKIPVYRLQATNIEIENDFVALLNKIILNEKNSGLGVQIIKINSNKTGFDKNNLELKMEIEKSLLEYSKKVEGNIQISDEKEYMIISNIDILQGNESLKEILALKSRFEGQNEELAVGIGEGKTIFQAERNARVALKLSLTKEGKIFYSNGKVVKGPLLNSKELEYKRDSDERIKTMAEEIEISPIYLEKIKSMIKKKKKNSFTSIEIAEVLNITTRSVNRIIKKILEKDYAEIVQVESSITAGRPRRVIKFKF
ncbi:hypothetical protein [Fusobacterium sp.]|uniref:hypothetical protein n=1 Tax=Fusobacterium sp. TaxID=68766 RepID=UPI0025BA0E54|nr:hypothetical protein [Fusobacterium sp.]